jgi:plastocyanin
MGKVLLVCGVLLLGALGVTGAGMAMGWGHSGMAPWNHYSGPMMGQSSPGSLMAQSGHSSMMGSRDWSELDRVSPVSTNVVVLTDQDAFSPMVIQVRAGTSVTWTSRDTDNHTVTFMPAMMMSGTILVPEGSFSYTFSSPGTYNYLCMYHEGMIGRVVVTAK